MPAPDGVGKHRRAQPKKRRAPSHLCGGAPFRYLRLEGILLVIFHHSTTRRTPIGTRWFPSTGENVGNAPAPLLRLENEGSHLVRESFHLARRARGERGNSSLRYSLAHPVQQADIG